MIVYHREHGWLVHTWADSYVPLTWSNARRGALGWIRHAWHWFIGDLD